MSRIGTRFLLAMSLATVGVGTVGGQVAAAGNPRPASTTPPSAEPSRTLDGAPTPENPHKRLHPGVMPRPTVGLQVNAAPAGAHLTYYGGRVISNVKVIQVFYGGGTYTSEVSGTGPGTIAAFYAGVTNSSYMDWLTEYNTPSQTIGRGSFAGQVHITPSASNLPTSPSCGSGTSRVTDAQIQAELRAQIAAGTLQAPDANTYYAVHFPANVDISQGGSCSGVGGGFCAYHSTVAANAATAEFYYGVLPDFTAPGMQVGCGSGTRFSNETSVSSHELIEATTDPEVGLATVLAPPLAWYDRVNGEIGDICNGIQQNIVGGDGRTYTVQQQFSNAQNNCVVSGPTVINDFSISAAPASVSLAPAAVGTSTISTAVTSGVAGTVALSVAGVPSGASASLSPTSVTAGGSSTLTINAGTAAAGTYSLTVTGTEGTTTHTTTVSLTVTAPASNDFSISAAPASVSLAPAAVGTSTISTAVTSGVAGTVALSVAGVPSGASASLSPTSVTAGGSSTLTINAGTAAASTYSMTVTGTEGTTTHTTTVSLTVTGTTTCSTGTGLINPDFESGLSGWTVTGVATTVAGGHTCNSAAQVGSTSPSTNSSVAQTFTAAANATGISFFYKMNCPDTIFYDWATATLRDNTTGTTATVLPKTCATSTAWIQKTAAVIAGHSYTLTLSNHDDNYPGDATYTLYDSVTLTTGAPAGGTLTNGGFEAGDLSSWTATGASETAVSAGAHSGTWAAQLGATGATSGDSKIAQTFTVPTGKTQLSLWYDNICPDTVFFDWATVTLRDNASGTTTTVLPRTCAAVAIWTNRTAAVVAGHSYTLTLTSHDDNYPGDPTYTLFDDVTLN